VAAGVARPVMIYRTSAPHGRGRMRRAKRASTRTFARGVAKGEDTLQRADEAPPRRSGERAGIDEEGARAAAPQDQLHRADGPVSGRQLGRRLTMAALGSVVWPSRPAFEHAGVDGR